MDRIHAKSGCKVRNILVLCFAVLALIAISESANAQPVAPLITPDGGYFKGAIQVGLQCPGQILGSGGTATIYYTTNGTTPTPTNGTAYVPGTPVNVASSLTLQAMAYNGTSSPVTSAAFTIGATTTTALPVISPNGGNYTTGPVTVTLSSATSGASIYYTTDGTLPTASSTLYSAPFQVSATANVQAIAVASGLVNSGIASSTFTLGFASACTAPTMSPTGGSFTGWTTVTVSSTTTGAIIRYTTDGSTPTATSTQYTGPKFIGNTTTFTVCAFANGYADSSPAAATFTATTPAPVQYNVTTYGASTTSSDNTAAVQAALNAAKNNNGPGAKWGYVYFPKGTYYFNSTSSLLPANTNNLVIDGQGSTLIFEQGIGLINAASCNNITVENMILDTSFSTATPVTVTEEDSTGYDCLLDPGFLATGVVTEPGLLQMDATQRTCARLGISFGGNNSLYTASTLGTGKVRITEANGPIRQGNYLNLRTYGSGNALNFNTCDGVTIDNVTIYSCPGMGITANASSDISLVNVNTLVSPGTGRLNSSGADATHFSGDKGLISYQDCQFQAQGDDCINICANYYTIQSVNTSANQIDIYYQYSDTNAPTIKVGEEIEFRGGTSVAPYGTALVTAISQLGGIPNVEQLTLATAPPAGIVDNSDVVDSLTWNSRLSVNRCNFIGNRARGILIQTPNSTVRNSRFQNESGAGIEVSTVLKSWYESTGTSNVQILNNSFENCNYGVGDAPGTIWVYAYNQSGVVAPAGVHTGMVIADNTIRDIDNGGIVVSSLSNADILNNTIENVAIHPDPTLPSYANEGIYAIDAANVRINNNIGVQSNYLRYLWNQWQPYWNPPASGAYNVQPFVIGFSQTSAQHAQWQISWNVQSPLPTGESVFAHFCNSSGADVLGLPTGSLGDPSTWVNGQRVATAVLPVNFSTVADGTYTIRLGIYSPTTGTRLQLLGDNDGSNAIIVGTVTLSGSGSTITYTSQQFDVTPTVSQFIQTGQRQFSIAYSWNVYDTLPTGEGAFAHLCDSSGNILEVLSTGTTPDPSTWAPGTQVVSTAIVVNLKSQSLIPDATNYTIRIGMRGTTGGPLLNLSGQGDGTQRIITGTFTTETGTLPPLGYDTSGTCTNISESGNTGF